MKVSEYRRDNRVMSLPKIIHPHTTNDIVGMIGNGGEAVVQTRTYPRTHSPAAGRQTDRVREHGGCGRAPVDKTHSPPAGRQTDRVRERRSVGISLSTYTLSDPHIWLDAKTRDGGRA